MQNKYVGDTGDFAKYLLLKRLSDIDLPLGINWYLVDNDASNDGRHIGYLDENNKEYLMYNQIDSDLLAKLKSILKDRTVENIKSTNVFPFKPLFYDVQVPINLDERKQWFLNSMVQLEECKLIFCDPDNGILVKSCKPSSSKSIKYVGLNEIKDYYESGRSVIVYQHFGSWKVNAQKQINDKLEILKATLGSNSIKIETLICNKGSVRFFFIIMQKTHEDILSKRIELLLLELKRLEHTILSRTTATV